MSEGMLQPVAPQPARSVVGFGNRGLSPVDLDGAWRCAQLVAKSGLAPKGMQSPESILVAATIGAEIGLTFMQSLQNIAVINGRPAVWGDALLALCQGTGEMVEFAETTEGTGEGMVAVCRVARERNGCARMSTEERFSVNDAKAAGLWGKQGPWKQYPRRMLKMRARGFALRDMFADVLKGVRPAEEVLDMPAEAATGTGTPFEVEEVEEVAQPTPVAPVATEPPGEATTQAPGQNTPVRRRTHAVETHDGSQVKTCGASAEQIASLEAAPAEQLRVRVEALTGYADPTFLRAAEAAALIDELTAPAAASAGADATPVEADPQLNTLLNTLAVGPGEVLCRGVNRGEVLKLGYCVHNCDQVQACPEYKTASQQPEQAEQPKPNGGKPLF